tara:strand:- start:1800 stop:2042 length:243 start_codon:yes stop_codon:yes gene_type:complete
MLIKMNKDELSKCYYRGTDRSCQAIEKLYEELYTHSGDPQVDEEHVIKLVQDCIRKVRSELDIIKTAVNEYSGKDEKYIK